ncbi:MAG: tRNA (adenosine(37)-N6)-threonylcarbamoyltransferase complex transferase subunit TsaD [Saprospiraceae bacterium]|nr:tRNA (adenosine(37)-N6)-threonylcarbamoyltransferase complex transferase subunit TsaD [Saprospiraceae bacterium]
MSIVLLAIESSCDDTSAAIIRDGKVLSNVTTSQDIHAMYGGVVPELASRAHQVHIVPVVASALEQAGLSLNDLSGIAFTRGPGLMGSLMVGVSFAKGLALSRNLPLIEVHHLHAHVLAQFANEPYPEFPFICLLVSGGHTQIMLVESHLNMTKLGTTLDDAAGEAFDKTGKLMGLEYPAGPQIDVLASSGQAIYSFPHPKLAGYDFSFSGFKTSVRNFIAQGVQQDPMFLKSQLSNICASVQHHIVEILLSTLARAAKDYNIRTLTIAGGVSANSKLRSRFEEIGREKGWEIFIPPLAYSTDNAAMIGIAGYFKFLEGEFTDLSAKAEARILFG